MAYRLPYLLLALHIGLCGLLLVVPCGAQRATKEEKTPPAGRVRGRVLYADTGHPVRLAQVRLVGLEEPAKEAAEPDAENDEVVGPSDYYERELKTVVTDLSGAFSWDGVEPGRYAAVVMGGNLVDFGTRFSEAENPLLNGKKRAEMFDGWFPVFTVTAGVTTEIEITARRGGVISGRILFPDGTPVVEAPLSLFRRAAEGKLQPVKFTRQDLQADTRGYYRITELPAGEYIVRAADRELQISPGHDENTVRSAGWLFYSYYAAGRKASKARPVAVQEGVESPDINITLKDVPARTLSGSVTVKGKPLAGASVSAAYRDPDTGATLKPLVATTGPQGDWRINGLPDGDYQFSVEAGKGKIAGAEDKPINALDEEQEVHIAGADLTDLKITLKTGASVAGEVALAPGAKVDFSFSLLLLEDKQEADEADESHREYFEKPGPFLFTRLKPGLHYFDWYSYDEQGFYLQKVLHKGRDITDQPLKLAASEELTEVQFVVATDFANVAGRAFADAAYKQPLDGGTIYFVPLKLRYGNVRRMDTARGTVYFVPPKPTVIAELVWYNVKIDETGEFEWKLPPGEYYVLASAELEDDDIEKTVQQHAARLPRITLKPNGSVTKWRVAEFKPPSGVR